MGLIPGDDQVYTKGNYLAHSISLFSHSLIPPRYVVYIIICADCAKMEEGNQPLPLWEVPLPRERTWVF